MMITRESNRLVITPAWNGLKQQILHLAQFGGSIQVIQGPAGAGKTAFFTLLQSENLGANFVAITVAPNTLPEAFFYDLIYALGLHPTSSASLGQLISSLRAYVQSQHSERQRIVVAVDDVHLLSEAALAALISVLQGSTDSGVGLHLIFFSESFIVERIDGLNLLDVTVHDAFLPVFSPSEVKKLLFAYNPKTSDPAFMSVEQIQTIWAESKGLPGAAIRLACQLREAKNTRSPWMNVQGLPVIHIAVLILLCSTLYWAFIYSGVEVDESLNHKNSDSIVTPRENPIQSDISEEINEVADAILSEDSSNIDLQKNESSAVFESLNATVNIAAADVNEKVDRTDSVSQVRLSATELNGQFRVDSITVLKNNSSSIADHSELLSNKADLDVLQKNEKSLLSYTPSGYALQIMALANKEKLQAYMSKQPNKAGMLFYETVRNGQTVYILLEGFYADKQSALMAVANLPASQSKAGPWPKRLQSVHDEILVNRRK